MDHKPIESLMTQRKLSAQQQRWINVLSDFSFEVKYIPGPSNVFADALSRIYSNKAAGTMRSESEHIHELNTPSTPTTLQGLTKPINAGAEAESKINLQVASTQGDTDDKLVISYLHMIQNSTKLYWVSNVCGVYSVKDSFYLHVDP
jgi:hypothetical protein